MKWLPEMTAQQLAWYNACPKSVLFLIAEYLALQSEGEDGGFHRAFFRVQQEWQALYNNGIVPQSPPKHIPSFGKRKKYYSQRTTNSTH